MKLTHLALSVLMLATANSKLVAGGVFGEDQEVPGTEPYDPETDPVVQEYNYQTQLFQRNLEVVKTDQNFAGFETVLQFRGITYTVDRRAEAKRAPARTPPTTVPNVRDLIGDLSVRARGGFRVRVISEVYNPQTGKLESRDFCEFDASGMWQADTSGMDEAMGKQHK